MTLRSDSETRVVLRKLCLLIPSYYVLYYTVSIILVASLDVKWTRIGKLPFRISWEEFTPTQNNAALGACLAMIATYTVAVLLNFFICKSSRKSWDYAATLSTLHFVLSCLVNLAFPTNWVWWLVILLCTIELGLVGELTVYYFKDMKEIHLAH